MTSYVMESSLQHASSAAGILKEKVSPPTPSQSEVYSPLSHASPSQGSRAIKPQSRPARLSTPELSVVSEDGEVLGIDAHTGLPKLAVELLPDMEESHSMGHRISSCSDSTSSKSSTPSQGGGGGPLSKRERKSVTFDPITDIKRQRSMSDSKKHEGSAVSSVPVEDGHTALSHHSIDSPPYARKRPAQKRPISLLNKNRSRSVFIKLQYPKTPPLPHRNLSVVGESDSDTDIQTAPVVDSGAFFGPSSDLLNQRRASDSTALGTTAPPHVPRTTPTCRTNSNSSVGGALEHPNPALSSSAPDASPNIQRWQGGLNRRSSFLYGTDDSDSDQDKTNSSTKGISRTSSMSSHVGDETYITPFAQILANLQRVRASFLALMDFPADTRTSHSRPHSISTPVPSPLPHKKVMDESRAKVAMETLEEFDWCLKKLETIDSAKSMGTMAQDKFKRLLSRELSYLSSNSRSGSQVAEWVNRMTSYDTSEKVDRALLPRSSQNDELMVAPQMEHHLSRSMAHDEWEKLRAKSGPNHDYCERVPTFGVSSPDMDNVKMREFMTQMDCWHADAFHLDTISGGNPLVSSSYMIFKKRNLFKEFQILPHTFINFISSIQSSYLPNPYHNCIHATDVLLATNFMLNSKALEDVFSPLEICAALFAAVIHDVGHPGRTNAFLINTKHELALLYNDNSVLENHHLALAFKTMQDPNCNFLEHFEADQRQAFRRMVIDMVLATDMARHFKHLGELKTLLETKKVANDGILVLDKYADRSEVLQCLIHCADLGNPSKPVPLAENWAKRVTEEQFLQGDEEKRLGIPLNPLGDRDQVCLGKCQVTFLDFIILPLWETWAELVYPDGQEMLDNLSKTREFWESQIKCASPPLSENEPEGEDPGSSKVNEHPVEEVVVAGDQCKEGSSMVKIRDSQSEHSCRLQNSSDTLASSNSPANQRRTSFKNIKETKIGQEIAPQDEEIVPALSSVV